MYFTGDLNAKLIDMDCERSNLQARLAYTVDEGVRARLEAEIARLDEEIERLDTLLMYEVCYGY